MSVKSRHPEYNDFADRWLTVKAVVDSKAKDEIKPIDPADVARTRRYRDDAILTNFTARTKQGLVGAVFRIAPKAELPAELDYVIDDATGDGLMLDQLAKSIVGDILESGRVGLLIDYPPLNQSLTMAQVEQLNVHARIHKYNATSIINWAATRIHGNMVLSLVVLEEHSHELNGFVWEDVTKYRVLRLDEEGLYVQEIYNEEDEIIERYEPRKKNGERWSEIPFVFIGSEDNNASVDNVPLYDLALLNIGHYKNSADYEESIHITGQPTLFISTDMSQAEWKASTGGKITLGSRAGYNIGGGGSATLLQPDPNQLADTAMKRKEEQAVMIGARLITPNTGVETAEAARIRHGSENSVLTNIVLNAETGLVSALYFMLAYESKSEEQEIKYKLNEQFFESKIGPNEIMSRIQLFDRGLIAKQDLRKELRKSDIIAADRTDEEIDAEAEEVSPFGDNAGFLQE